jgi:DNA-binding CsgD family transcriptional regulator
LGSWWADFRGLRGDDARVDRTKAIKQSFRCRRRYRDARVRLAPNVRTCGKAGAKDDPMWKRAALYGVLLAAGALALQWLDYQRLARAHSGDIYIFLISLAFLVLGVFIGARVIGGTARRAAFDGNPKAQAALRISARELAVLKEIAAGRSNKEIARNLNVSPSTVKTHVARLFEKLDAKRRTDATHKARELGIVP